MLVLSALVSAHGQIPAVQSVGRREVADVAQRFVKSSGWPGLWVAVFWQGKELGSVASGYADVQSKRPASLEDVLWLGSVSKPVVATVYASVVESGLVSYDNTLAEVDLPASVSNAARTINARKLIAHTSGLPKDVQIAISDRSPAANISNRKAAMLKVLVGGLSPQGTEVYSNVGYTALAVILEAKTRKSFEAWLQELLVRRSGLTSFNTGTSVRSSAPYSVEGSIVKPAKGEVSNQYEWMPSGSVRASIRDIGRFGLLHCLNRFVQRPLFGSDRLTASLHTLLPNSTRTLSGFEVEPHSDGRYVLFHTGLMSLGRGDTMILYVVPKSGMVIAAYTNCSGNDANGESITIPRLRSEIVNPIFHWLMKNQ